jgi:signal peptidase I
VNWSVARGIALSLAAVVTVCGGWLLLAPTTVGGPVSLVISSGPSMQPKFHTGDLAVLRSSSTYHVGEVVGYHSPTLHNEVVLHRLVAADGNRWNTKGDHNSWLDPDHPTNADIVGKVWLHVPKGGLLLTRVLLPLAFVGFLVLLVPFRRHESTDENGEPMTQPSAAMKRGASRGRHTQRWGLPRFSAGWRAEVLSRQTCTRGLAAGLTLAIIGMAVLIVGYARPLHRTATVTRTWQTTAAFGWTGTSDSNLIYPGGRVTAPAPIFPKVLDRVTMTATVSSHGHPLGSPTLTATVSDASGWTQQWPLGTTSAPVGPNLRLSGSLDLNRLLDHVASVQATTGVSSPATLTLSVGDSNRPAVAAPSLAFSLSKVTFKPQGPLTVTKSGSTSTRAAVPASLRVSGHEVSVGRLRQTGAVAVALGLIVALAAGQLSRGTKAPTAQDRLLRLFSGRVVHLTNTESLERSCLDVNDAESLAAFAATPAAVLYVVDEGEHRTLIAERGGTRLRYVPEQRAGTPTARTEEPAVSPEIPEQRTSSVDDGASVESDAINRA